MFVDGSTRRNWMFVVWTFLSLVARAINTTIRGEVPDENAALIVFRSNETGVSESMYSIKLREKHLLPAFAVDLRTSSSSSRSCETFMGHVGTEALCLHVAFTRALLPSGDILEIVIDSDGADN